MSLTYKELQEIRKIMEETVQPNVDELEPLKNDGKEIYGMVAELQKSPEDTSFEKLKLENKIIKLHGDLVEAARQAGVSLPSH